MYRLPTGEGPADAEALLKGTHREPLILLGWIGCVPSLAVTGRIEPSSKSLVVAVCICGVVASYGPHRQDLRLTQY